jgi:hypothetical protein
VRRKNTSKNGIAAAENAADAETDIPLPNNRWILPIRAVASCLHQSFKRARGGRGVGAHGHAPHLRRRTAGRLAGLAAEPHDEDVVIPRSPPSDRIMRRGSSQHAEWARGAGMLGHTSQWLARRVRTTNERSLQTGRGAVGAEACGSGHGATMSTPWRGLRVASDRRENERQRSRHVAFGLCNADPPVLCACSVSSVSVLGIP